MLVRPRLGRALRLFPYVRRHPLQGEEFHGSVVVLVGDAGVPVTNSEHAVNSAIVRGGGRFAGPDAGTSRGCAVGGRAAVTPVTTIATAPARPGGSSEVVYSAGRVCDVCPEAASGAVPL